MRIYNGLFIFFYFFLFWNHSAKIYSQNKPRLYFHSINTQNGLSSNFINDITQDSLGFIWVATSDGLNRYDGSTFKVFKSGDPINYISNNYVQCIQAINNKLFIGTDEGLTIYNNEDESLKILNEEENKLLGNSISELYKIPNKDQMIIGVYRGGLQYMSLSKSNRTFKIYNKLNKNLSSKEVSSVIKRKNELWVATYNGGLNKIDFNKNKLVGTYFKNKGINVLYLDYDNNLWIGTQNGLIIITANNEIIELKKTETVQTGLSDDDILCFQEDGEGYMWVGTRNGGLDILSINTVLDKKKQIDIEWYLPSEGKNSVNNRTISVLFKDRDKNMWIGTPTGINFTKIKGEIVEIIRHEKSNQKSLSHNRIGALESSENGNIWIGTDGGGLDYFNPKNKNFKHFVKDSTNTGLSSNYILSLLEDSIGRLWVGTYRGGINCYNNGKFKHFLKGSPSAGSDVRVIFEGSNHKIWVGTNRGGLFLYNEEAEDFSNVSALAKLDIRDIAEDNKGNLWLATYGSGLKKYNPSTKQTVTYSINSKSKFPSDIVFSVLSIGNNQILAGTRYEGVVLLNSKTGIINRITEREGLSNNSIVGMIKGNDRYVWLSSFNGINRYDIITGEILNISALNNIQQGEFNVGAIEKDTNGIIYVGGNNGLNFFKGANIRRHDVNASIYFEDLKILNQKVPIQKNNSQAILNKSLYYQDNITLAHNENSFSVNFNSLNYPFFKNTNFFYKLDGYNDIWISANRSNTANFTKVPPGRYKLVIKNESGFKQDVKAELGIIIMPPFWNTWQAYVLYVICIGLFIYLLSKYFSERVKLQNSIAFEQKRYQLERQLNEERLRFFTGFSHELKTPLTLILAPIENLLEKVKQKDSLKDLQFIKRNAKNLRQAIDSLLEFRKSEEGLSQLNCSQYNLKVNLKHWLDNYQPLARDKKVQLKLDYTINEKNINCDIKKIAVIMNNILSNAIKYSESNTEIVLKVYCESNLLKIKVTNQGEGISPKEIDHIFEWYYRAGHQNKTGTGIGLALSKNFAELHKGTINVTSICGENTSFTLCLPEDLLNKETLIKKESTLELNQEKIVEIEEIPITLERDNEKSLSAETNRNIMLIIDDNSEVRLFLDNLFKNKYDLLFAENGQDGMKKATKYIPDIILSDVMMPIKNGIDLCDLLKCNLVTSHIPIILLTAKTNTESISTGYQKGADLYITKPFKPKILKIQVQSLLENREKMRSHYLQFQDENIRNGEENKSKLINSEKKFLQQIEDIVLKPDYLKKLNTALLVKELGMSRTSLYRKIKALTGLNINELIRDIKLKKAAYLIYNEDYSVSDASFSVGFSSVKYFSKIFKEKFGVNPSVYRNKDIDV